MPFKSEKQRRWMHANKPEMADEWEEKEKNEGTEMKIKGSELKQIVAEELTTALNEMCCGGQPHPGMMPPAGLALGGMESQVPMIIIQTSEEKEDDKLPAETHPTRIYHKEEAPPTPGLEEIIPMLLRLEGQIVRFSSKQLTANVKRSLKRILREANRGGGNHAYTMGSIAGSIPASTGMGVFKREDNTEASMTPNYEVQVEQLVHDMLSSGMTEAEILDIVQEYVEDAASWAVEPQSPHDA